MAAPGRFRPAVALRESRPQYALASFESARFFCTIFERRAAIECAADAWSSASGVGAPNCHPHDARAGDVARELSVILRNPGWRSSALAELPAFKALLPRAAAPRLPGCGTNWLPMRRSKSSSRVDQRATAVRGRAARDLATPRTCSRGIGPANILGSRRSRRAGLALRRLLYTTQGRRCRRAVRDDTIEPATWS